MEIESLLTEIKNPKLSSPVIEAKLKRWCDTLLDLTKRNPSLHFLTHVKKGKNKGHKKNNIFKLKLTAQEVFEKLVNKGEVLSLSEAGIVDLSKGFRLGFGRRKSYYISVSDDVPEPVENEDEETEDESEEIEILQDLENETFDSTIQEDEEDIDNNSVITQCTRIKRDTESILEERGTHVLYIICGLFEWRDQLISDEILNTPILFIPVTIQKTRTKDRYSIQIAEAAEVEFNPTFSYLLKKNYQIDLDKEINDILNNAEPKEENIGIKEIFELVEGKLTKLLQGKVKDEVWLGKFWFEKLVLLTDIQKNIDAFVNDPIIQNICGEKPQIEIEHKTDLDELSRQAENKKPLEIYEVLDADSSQRRAIEAAINKKNFVLIGPPGTGKSQTIANIIAECLVRGKKVLFVSEKLAALKVVKKKLEQCNLGKLCISIHGKETKKKDFYSSLYDWYEEVFVFNPKSNPDEIIYEELSNIKKRLNDYALALSLNHSSLTHVVEKIGNEVKTLELTNQYVQGKLLGLEGIPEVKTRINIDDLDVRKFKSQKESLEKTIPYKDIVLRQTVSDWFCTQLPGPYTIELEEDILKALAKFDLIDDLSKIIEEINSLLQLNTTPSLSKLIDLTIFIKEIVDAPELESSLLNPNQVSESVSKLRTDINLHKTYTEERKNLANHFNESFLEKDLEGLKENFSDKYKEDRLRWLKPGYWKVKKEVSQNKVNKNDKDVTDDIYFNEIERGIKIKKLACDIESHAKEFSIRYGSTYNGENTDWEKVSYLLNYADSLFKHLSETLNMQQLENVVSPALNECLQSKYSPIKDKLKILLTKLESKLNEFDVAYLSLMHFLPLTYEKEKYDEKNKLSAYPKYTFNNNDFGCKTLEEIKTWTKKLEEDINQEPPLLERWLEFKEIKEEIDELNLSDFLEDFSKLNLNYDNIVQIFEKRTLELILINAERESPVLAKFTGTKYQKLQADFKTFDRQALKLNQVRILELVSKQIKDKLIFHQEPRLLKKLGQQKRPKKPIRQAILETQDLFFTLKPCWMMSPLTVSQYLPPDASLFDVVIFDEASQVRPADSIGAIFRGDQIIVVGDPRQLPPTNFFQTMAQEDRSTLDDENEDSAEESIIDEVLSKSYDIEEIPLKWHYRSKSEDLFSFASHNIYPDLELITFPNPKGCRDDGRPLGVKHVLVDGVYDRGKTRTNQKEAEKVADLVVEHYTRYGTDRNDPNYLSLGVIAFSAAQEDAILNAIQRRKKELPDIETILEEKDGEGFFVKNLETVQGDERDHIIISVGYGPDKTGKMVSNFGPLNSEGGYRRLNVAITRARYHLMIVSSFSPKSFSSTSTQQGAQLLLKYLRFAESGKEVLFEDKPQESNTSMFNSPFEEEVFKKLKKLGLDIHTQLGCSGYRIDMAVVNPKKTDEYLFGIECDGKTYHGTFSAKDRDRLRQEILEDRSWKIYRIWSRDWMKNSKKEVNKLMEFYESLVKQEEEKELLSDLEMNFDE
jgi:very-short-patch-repair endonuclease/flagellar biosynthesis GTPase FlhF